MEEKENFRAQFLHTSKRARRPLPDLPRCLCKIRKGIQSGRGLRHPALHIAPARKSGLGVKSVEVVIHLHLKSAIPQDRDAEIDLRIVPSRARGYTGPADCAGAVRPTVT